MEEKTFVSPDETNVSTDSIKCKGCGSNMSFDPETQKLKCEYCGYTEEFEQSSAVVEISLENALSANATWKDETLSFRCENCGAQIITQKNETASKCPFCETSHVVAIEDLQGIKPNALVPFKFSKEQIKQTFKTWAKRKLFAPGDFKKSASTDKTNGVYVPFFTFDSSTSSVYTGRIGKRHTKTIKTKNGTKTETYIVWRNISGTITHFFDDILVSAGAQQDEKNMEKLAPFEWESYRVYDNEYLSGFTARRYEKDIKNSWEDAKKKIDSKLRSLILSRYSYDVVGYLNVSTGHSNVTYKYVLLPVWVLNYSYRKKKYQIYANGSTGKIIGKSPVSIWKVLIAVGIGLAILAGIIAIVHFFG